MRHEQEGHEEFQTAAFALRQLAGKQAPADVERRIVEGALARRTPAFAWGKAFVGLALAGAATAAVVIGLRVDTPAPVPLPVAAGPEAPAAGSVREAGTFAVGPHRVEVASGGSVRFASVDPGAAEFRVEHGSAVFDVEKLAPGESFRVRTDQVLVEVVGTRFEVGADGDCSSVSVTEGRVRVTQPNGVSYLTVGESGRYCAPTDRDRTSGDALVRDALVLVSGGRELQRAAALLEQYRTEHPGGALEEEALFHLTLVKARLGDAAGAERLAASFRQRFPDSPRAQRLDEWLARARR